MSYNNSSSQIIGTKVALTPFELWFQQIAASFLCGGLSAILHCLIAISIYRVEKLESRFFVFLFFISIGRCLYGLARVITFIYRTGRTIGIFPMNISWLACHTVHLLLFGTQSLDLLLLLVVILDLVLCFLNQAIYNRLTIRQAVHVSLGCYIFTILTRFLPSYAFASNNIVTCYDLFNVVSKLYASWARYSEIFLTLAILVTYAILWWAVKTKYYGKTDNNSTTKRSIKLMPFLRSQIIGHILFVCTSRAMQLASNFLDTNSIWRQRWGAWNTVVVSFGILADAFIFYRRHPKLWYATLAMMCGERVANKLGTKPTNPVNTTQAAPSVRLARPARNTQVEPIEMKQPEKPVELNLHLENVKPIGKDCKKTFSAI